MICISFYTSNGRYPDLAARLRASCDRVGLRNKILSAPEQPTWYKTINMKAGFILQMLLDAREPVLWLDCDCEVRAYPSFFGKELPPLFDFAALNWLPDDPNYDGDEILNSGGVTYWNYTAPAIELLVRWQQACQQNPDAIDDQTLDAVWKRHQMKFHVKPLWLPRTYNWMEPQFGPAPEDVVIWHEYAAGKHREEAA